MYQRLCDINTLFNAWKHVKSKKSAGGIDGFSVLSFEENLQENLQHLQEELQKGEWNPSPYLKHEKEEVQQIYLILCLIMGMQ